MQTRIRTTCSSSMEPTRNRLAIRNAAEMAARSTNTAQPDRMGRRFFLLANWVHRVIAPCQSRLGMWGDERLDKPGETLRGASAKDSNFISISQFGITDAPPNPGVTRFAPPSLRFFPPLRNFALHHFRYSQNPQ